MTTFVIVGGGLAGAKAAETLRAEGFDRRDRAVRRRVRERPYERAAAGQGATCWARSRTGVGLRPPRRAGTRSTRVDLRTGVSVAAIERLDAHDRRARRARDRLRRRAARSTTTSSLLATGASPRKLAIPGEPTLATCSHPAHAGGFRRAPGRVQAATRRVVIVGAGWIGLETAAAGRHRGLRRSPSSSRSRLALY